jgi:hypothetical protein
MAEPWVDEVHATAECAAGESIHCQCCGVSDLDPREVVLEELSQNPGVAPNAISLLDAEACSLTLDEA